MAYLAVGDFKYGMDRRRPQAVGIPGTLWVLKNAVLSRGGDIERCKKWVLTHTLPENSVAPFNSTHGLAVRNNQLTTFVWPPYSADFPYDVTVQALENPNGTSEDEVLTDAFAKSFDNKLYAIADFQDGNRFHFYDAVRVEEWETDVAVDLISKNSVAQRIANVLMVDSTVDVTAQEDRVVVKAAEAGDPFTLSFTSAGIETPSTGTIEVTLIGTTTTITNVTVDAVTITGAISLTWVSGDTVDTFALKITNAINAYTSTSGFTATVLTDTVTIIAPPGQGSTPNGDVVAVTTAGLWGATIGNMAGGISAMVTGSIGQTMVQANVVAVPEVRATGEVEITSGSNGGQITGVTINGVELLDGPVNWLSNVSATANALVVAINTAANTAYLASAVAGVVTLLAAEGTGATVNGHVVAATSSGISTTTANVSGGVTEIEAVKQIEYLTVLSVGNVAPWAEFDIVLNGTSYYVNVLSAGMGNSIFVQKNRVFVTAGSTVQYCKLNTPLDWTDADASSGSGFINIGNAAEGAQYLYGIEEYNGKAAIFAESTVIIYQFFADAQQITSIQTMQNTGTLSVGAVKAYGADDVFYLDKTGIRSLRSRDGYDAAFASDIGSAIDPFVSLLVDEVGRPALIKAQSVVETKDGRFMMALGQYIVTLSYFPASKITAWSYIDFGQQIDNLVRCGDRVVLRTGNELYTYGGEDGDEYPENGEFNGIAETPFMSASDPATKKFLQSYDHIAEGEWLVEVLPNPKDRTVSEVLGRFTSITNNDLTATLSQYTSLFAIRYTCDKAGFAGLSAIATHFEKGEKN